MRLLNYKLNVHPSVITMDRYFHLMFRQELPYVNGEGKITDDHMKYMTKPKLIQLLTHLTSNHPVGWQLTVESKQKIYEYVANKGEVEYRYVRHAKDGDCKLAA